MTAGSLPSVEQEVDRRGFLRRASAVLMGGGLLAGYGTFAAFAGKFLYRSDSKRDTWTLVSLVSGMRVGAALSYRTPAGASVAIVRRAEEGSVGDFIALSSVCPHLGCQVHWEAHNNRFFCPCHNGTFDAQGNATGGPPFQAGQDLPRFPLKLQDGMLFIQLPPSFLALGPGWTEPPKAGCGACAEHRVPA